MEIRTGQRYRHYKNGKTYVILAVGRDESTEERVVIYQAEYDDPKFGDKAVWVRFYDVFCEQVDHEGKIVQRFTLL